MATVSEPEESPAQGEGEDEEYAPTPFDNPFFLPVVLLAFSVWFIYDGWFNPEMEWIKFNRGGAAVSLSLGAWFLYRAIRQRNAERGQESEASER